MHYVNILISEVRSEKYYIGYTDDIGERMKKHNTKQTYYSKRYAPWKLETYVAFREKSLARNFEKYLKHGSGFAFLKRHLI